MVVAQRGPKVLQRKLQNPLWRPSSSNFFPAPSVVEVVRSSGAKVIKKMSMISKCSTNATLGTGNKQCIQEARYQNSGLSSHSKPSWLCGHVRDWEVRRAFWFVALHFCECQAIDFIAHEVVHWGKIEPFCMVISRLFMYTKYLVRQTIK